MLSCIAPTEMAGNCPWREFSPSEGDSPSLGQVFISSIFLLQN